jgi:hypothetical protein
MTSILLIILQTTKMKLTMILIFRLCHLWINSYLDEHISYMHQQTFICLVVLAPQALKSRGS